MGKKKMVIGIGPHSRGGEFSETLENNKRSIARDGKRTGHLAYALLFSGTGKGGIVAGVRTSRRERKRETSGGLRARCRRGNEYQGVRASLGEAGAIVITSICT